METIPIRHINVSENAPNVSESFRIRDVRDLLGGKDMIQELHRHDFFFILALKKGSGDHEIDFNSHKVCDNSIFFLRPGQVHQLTLKSKSTGYLMEFSTDFYYPYDKLPSQLLRQASHRNICLPDPKAFERLLVTLGSMLEEYKNKHERYQEVIKANLGIFFIELVRNRQNLSNPQAQASPYTQERLEDFLELLEKNISKHKQVSEYADLLNLSPFQLNAITKATLGKTSSEIINEYIILEAKRYLLATSSQVSQIAYHLGYEDVSYFIRFFKKQAGYSPEAFRRTSGKSH